MAELKKWYNTGHQTKSPNAVKTKSPNAVMRFKVFISSVQSEFAAERQMLTEYVRKDARLGTFQTTIWWKTAESEVSRQVAYDVA